MPEAFDASGSSDAHDTTRTSLARPPVDRKANADRMDRSGQRRNELLGSKTDEDHEGTVIPGSAKECLRADARTPMTFDIYIDFVPWRSSRSRSKRQMDCSSTRWPARKGLG